LAGSERRGRVGRLRRHRDGAFGDRLRAARVGRPSRGRLPQCDGRERLVERAGMEALTVGVAGLGHWGPNLARNFDDLPGSRLKWLCDRDEERLAAHGHRHPEAETTTRFEDLLEDPDVDAVVVATPVVTHFELTRDALLAGKHVFVE